MAVPRHAPKPGSPRAGDPEAGAFVKIIEMVNGKGGVESTGLLEKVGPRLKHHSFPWRVLLPVSMSPRLRGLILLNLVRGRGASTCLLSPPPSPAASGGSAPRICGPPLYSARKHRLRHYWPYPGLARPEGPPSRTPPPPLPQVCLACASAFVVLKESQENVDPFVFQSVRFVIAASVFSPFMRKAMRDERVVKAGAEIGFWAAGGAWRCCLGGGGERTAMNVCVRRAGHSMPTDCGICRSGPAPPRSQPAALHTCVTDQLPLSCSPPAGYLTQSIGMLTADASRGAFLSGFTVVVVPLMAGLFGTAKLKRTTWVAVGAALVSTPGAARRNKCHGAAWGTPVVSPAVLHARQPRACLLPLRRTLPLLTTPHWRCLQVGISLLEDSGAPASWGDFWSFASAVLFGAQVRGLGVVGAD